MATEGKKDILDQILTVVYIVAAVTVLFIIIRKVVKSMKKPPHDKTGGDDPDTYFKNKGAHGDLGVNDPKRAPDYDPNEYTIYDEASNGLNAVGTGIEKAIENELYANFYTSDSVILSAIRQLKTVGDWAKLNDYWNTVVFGSRDKMTLPTKMAQEMFTSNFNAAYDYINSLPKKLK